MYQKYYKTAFQSVISNFADPLKENGSLKSRLEEFAVITVIVILQYFSYFSNLFFLS